MAEDEALRTVSRHSAEGKCVCSLRILAFLFSLLNTVLKVTVAFLLQATVSPKKYKK